MASIASPTDLPQSWALDRPRSNARPLRHVEKCMGTVFSFDIAAPGITRADLWLVLAWLHDMDRLFSTYRADSQISAINAGRLRIADAAAEVHEVLAACEEFRCSTDGYFSARPDGRTLDPSGYVKGWAVQTASQMLAAAGSVNHCVNGGGDVVCIGRPATGRDWRIGVVDPHRRDALIRTIVGAGPIAVATSGLAERGAHVLDPHTARPATELAGVTVTGPDLVTADVHATAAVAMGTRRATDWLAERPAVRATLVTVGGRVIDVGAQPVAAASETSH